MEARHHPAEGCFSSKALRFVELLTLVCSEARKKSSHLSISAAHKVRRRCSFTGEQGLKQPYA
ncbi:hypothetical protein GQ55_9G422100 [Panicum hallii var. hallii]|uniref:Uncharacterized protein n=1 Tax=Panicum hallii var. hallii TaxID=1504633 RepID=A0A2T7CAQ5_9POAL|nr:hypothetical protein GQ55_9G422100 [Panicum hallii var. hallii]